MDSEAQELIRADRILLIDMLIRDFKKMRWNMTCRRGGVRHLETIRESLQVPIRRV
jgi:hypothetical protein